MSANKLKYFEVTTTAVVRANNMTDAEAIARGRRNIQGQVLVTDTDISRISANEAQSWMDEA